MPTMWSDILAAAMNIIDDVRWEEQLKLSPATFYRAKSEFIELALPLLSSPPELLATLENGMTPATYDDYTWVSDSDSLNAETVLYTNKIGYELMSATIVYVDDTGVTSIIPCYDIEYESETGRVVIPKQEEVGIEYVLDFYNDGSFEELTASQKRLYALAVAVVWDEHFERNWLNLQPKIKDASFNTINESNYMEKGSERLKANRQSFNDELKKYEQSCAYYNVVPTGFRRRKLI